MQTLPSMRAESCAGVRRARLNIEAEALCESRAVLRTVLNCANSIPNTNRVTLRCTAKSAEEVNVSVSHQASPPRRIHPLRIADQTYRSTVSARHHRRRWQKKTRSCQLVSQYMYCTTAEAGLRLLHRLRLAAAPKTHLMLICRAERERVVMVRIAVHSSAKAARSTHGNATEA